MSSKTSCLHMGKHMALHQPPRKSSTDAERPSSPPLWSPPPLTYYSSLRITCCPHSATTWLGGKRHTQRCPHQAAASFVSCWSLDIDWFPDCRDGAGTPISKAGWQTGAHSWSETDQTSLLRGKASATRSPTGKHLYLSHTNTDAQQHHTWQFLNWSS